MKTRFALLWLVVSACLAGCRFYYLMGNVDAKEDDPNALSNTPLKRAFGCIRCEMKAPEIDSAFHGKHRMKYAEAMDEGALLACQKNEFIKVMQDSGLFSACEIVEDTDVGFDEGGVFIRSNCAFSYGFDPLAPLIVFSFGLYPNYLDYTFTYAFEVCKKDQRLQYRMEETVRGRLGWLMLLAAPFVDCGTPKEAFASLNRSMMTKLLHRMKIDGFFTDDEHSADLTLPVHAGKQKDVLAAERKKNLDSLLKAGVITEEEYKKEIGKEAK